MKRNLLSVLAIVLMLLMLPTSTVLAANGDMSITALNDVHGGAGPFLRSVTLQGFRYIGALAEENVQKAEEGILKEGKLLYETYVPALDEELSAYRENALGEISYAAYDRFFYYDIYSLPVGKLTLIAEDGDYTGLRAQIKYREKFCSTAYYDEEEKHFLLEYYELQDMVYFSYAQEGESAAYLNLPYFMCVKGMERLYAIEENADLDYSVFGQEFFRDPPPFVASTEQYLPKKEELRELIWIDGGLYKIDRERQALFLLPHRTHPEDMVFVDWMQDLKALCRQDIMIGNSVSAEELQKYLPKGYTFWRDEPVATDINEDGFLDVLAVLIPIKDSYEYKEELEYWYLGPPYLPEYSYQELWFFAGQPEGGYQAYRVLEELAVIKDIPGRGDYNGEWDSLTQTRIFAFPGGFTLEYFVGRAPFETRLVSYAYVQEDTSSEISSKEVPSFKFAGITDNDSNEDGFVKLEGELLGENQISLSEHINGNYWDLLWDYYDPHIVGAGRYTEYSLIGLADAALAEKINTSLAEEADRLFAAADALGVHDISLNTDLVYANSNILVFSFEIRGDTIENTNILRKIPITINLQTGEVLDYKEYLTEEELQELFFCKQEECNAAEALLYFTEYDNYERLLNTEEAAMTLRLTEEGLLLCSTRTGDRSYSWLQTHLIPRSCFLESPLAALWDDWPGEMY